MRNSAPEPPWPWPFPIYLHGVCHVPQGSCPNHSVRLRNLPGQCRKDDSVATPVDCLLVFVVAFFIWVLALRGLVQAIVLHEGCQFEVCCFPVLLLACDAWSFRRVDALPERVRCRCYHDLTRCCAPRPSSRPCSELRSLSIPVVSSVCWILTILRRCGNLLYILQYIPKHSTACPNAVESS